MSGSDLYLLAGGRYLYVEWADILPETIYDRGRWSITNGVVELASDHELKNSDRPRNHRYVIFRLAVDGSPTLRLIGTSWELPYFEQNGRDDSPFMLLINSMEQTERYSPDRSLAVYKRLMHDAWNPGFFRE